MEKRELVIIGAGPGGLAAAVYARRAGLDVLVLEKGKSGGQILITHEVENWPGAIHATGQELADNFHAHAAHFGAEFRNDLVRSLKPEGNRVILCANSGEISARAVILATGASFRKLGCPGEAKFTGMGVSYCAVCDGAFFEELEVAVIGGGNTAVEEALYLTQFASKVYIVHRRDEFRADSLPVSRAMDNPKIVPVWDSVVSSIEGKDAVEKIVLRNVKTGDLSDLPVDGVFVFVGTVPNSMLVSDCVDCVDGGWVVTDRKMATSVPGIFAVGDVRDTPLRQVVTAAADGAIAAMSAYAHIAEQKHGEKKAQAAEAGQSVRAAD